MAQEHLKGFATLNIEAQRVEVMDADKLIDRFEQIAKEKNGLS